MCQIAILYNKIKMVHHNTLVLLLILDTCLDIMYYSVYIYRSLPGFPIDNHKQ